MRARTDACKYSLTTLTARERQIVRLVSKGLSNREVASRLNLTEGTIKAHLHNIYQKLAINNRTALAALVVFLSW
jgi:two-component system, NarL family, nitrate/nitrite response regulator NarL